MNLIRTWLILIASVAIVCNATLFPYLQALSPYDFNITKDGSISDPAAASITLFVKPKGGSFRRQKRESSSDAGSTEDEKRNLEERDSKILFQPARWDFSPTSGAAVTVGAMSALSTLIWTIIHEAKKGREEFPDGFTPLMAMPASAPMNSFGNSYGSQNAPPSPYYPSYDNYYQTPPKAKPPKKIKVISPMKGWKAIRNEAMKGITKLQNQFAKPSKGKKKKQKPAYYPYYPQAPAYAPASSYPAPSYPEPTYAAPSYPAPSYPAPSYPAPSYPEPSYVAPSYPAPSYAAPSPVPDYNPPPSYPAPSYVHPPEPVYPREEAPTYGVAPTPEPYVPPPTQAPYVPPPTPAPYVPPPTPSPYVPPPTPSPYVPPPTPSPYVPPPTPAPYVPPPPQRTTPVPIQYESFIPIGPSPQRPRQLNPFQPSGPMVDGSAMTGPVDGPPMMGPADMPFIPSALDPTPFVPSSEEVVGLWGRPSEEAMSWLAADTRETNTNENAASTSSDSASVSASATVSDETGALNVESIASPVQISLAEPAVTPATSIVPDDPTATTPIPPESNL